MFKVLFHLSLLLIASINAFSGPQDEIRISKCLDKSGFFKEHEIVGFGSKYFIFGIANEPIFPEYFEYDRNLFKNSVIEYLDLNLPKLMDFTKEEETIENTLEVIQLLKFPIAKDGKFDRELVLKVLSEEKLDSSDPRFGQYNILCNVLNSKLDSDRNFFRFRPEENSKTLIVAFSGNFAPIFNFLGSLEKHPVNVLYLKDLQENWYINGFYEGSRDVLAYLNEFINIDKFTKVKFIGSSSGAWAAMYFGLKLNVDEVCAFSPIFPNKRHDQDLLYYFVHSEEINAKTKVNVYFSSNCKIDSNYASFFKNSKNICLHPYLGWESHSKIGPLKETGAFDKIIKKFVGL